MTYGVISHGATGVRAAVDQTYNRKTLHLIGLEVVMIEYKKLGSTEYVCTLQCLGGRYMYLFVHVDGMTRAPGCFRGAMLGLPLQVSTSATPSPWYRRSGTWIELHFEKKKGFARVCPRSQQPTNGTWGHDELQEEYVGNSCSTAAFARPSTEYDLMDDTVASQAEGRRRFLHIYLSKESVIHMFQSWMANGCLMEPSGWEKLSYPASESQRKAGSEATKCGQGTS